MSKPSELSSHRRFDVCCCIGARWWVGHGWNVSQVLGKYNKKGTETTFTATGLSKEGANRYMFTYKNKKEGTEKEISVAEYFAKVIGIRLEFPGLQCVLVRLLPQPNLPTTHVADL